MGHITQVKKLAAALGIVTTMSVLAVSPAFAGDTAPVSQGVTAGALTVSVTSDPSFSDVVYSHSSSRNSNANMTMQVDDSRGGDVGWNVQIVSSGLVHTVDGTKTMGAAAVSVQSAGSPALVAGQAIDSEVNGPLAGSGGALDTARKVIFANANYGNGTYDQILGLRVAVPALQKAGTYVGTLTITEVSGPGV